MSPNPDLPNQLKSLADSVRNLQILVGFLSVVAVSSFLAGLWLTPRIKVWNEIYESQIKDDASIINQPLPNDLVRNGDAVNIVSYRDNGNVVWLEVCLEYDCLFQPDPNKPDQLITDVLARIGGTVKTSFQIVKVSK